MHRLVQLVTRRWLLTESKIRHFYMKALSILAQIFPEEVDTEAALCSAYLPHAISLLTLPVNYEACDDQHNSNLESQQSLQIYSSSSSELLDRSQNSNSSLYYNEKKKNEKDRKTPSRPKLIKALRSIGGEGTAAEIIESYNHMNGTGEYQSITTITVTITITTTTILTSTIIIIIITVCYCYDYDYDYEDLVLL